MALGIILYFLLSSLRIPLIFQHEINEMSFLPYVSYFTVDRGYLYILTAVYYAFLSGCIWSGVAIVASSFVQNSLIVSCSPFITYFFINQLFKFLSIPTEYRPDYWLTLTEILKSNSITMIASSLCTVLFLVFCGSIFQHRIKGRLLYE
jgi:hypothetical protein